MFSRLRSHPNPVNDYPTAVARCRTLQEQTDGADLNPVCRTILLTHGTPTSQVVILWHGLTSCPQQFALLGEQFYQRDCNVLIPRMPYHGLAAPLTTALAQLRAEQLVALADEAVDIACGLGEQIVVMGLSAGGVLAGWIAQTRPEVRLAVLLSPAFGVSTIPTRYTWLAAWFSLLLPNRFIWWDPALKEEGPGPKHAYPRFSTRALAQVLRLGFAVRRAAKSGSTAVANLLIITNNSDQAISSEMVAQMTDLWRYHTSARVQTFIFGADLQLDHDFIEPEAPAQQVEVVYPILIDLVQRSLANL